MYRIRDIFNHFVIISTLQLFTKDLIILILCEKNIVTAIMVQHRYWWHLVKNLLIDFVAQS